VCGEKKGKKRVVVLRGVEVRYVNAALMKKEVIIKEWSVVLGAKVAPLCLVK
jgi:hypothetical protein